MSQYPEAISDLAWFRQEIEGLQAQVRELQRGPAVPQPTLLFGTYAAMMAVVGKALQRAWVDLSTESVVGRRGEWVYRPGTGWVRPWITGEFVPYQGQSVPAFCLPATGATYKASDYPDLAAAFGVASGTFTVTNMGGRVIVGAGTVADANGTVQTFTQGQKGGELMHVLSAAESGLPSHAHSLIGGSHSILWGQSSNVWMNNAVATGGSPPGNQVMTWQGVWDKTSNAGGGSASSAHSLMQPWAAQPVAIRI